MVLLLAGCFEGSTPPASDADNRTPGQGEPPRDDDEASGDDVPFRTLAAGHHSGTSDVRAVYDDEASWRAFWADLMSSDSEPPAAPEVDFDQERVVAVVLDTKSSGGWVVRVNHVTRTGDETHVQYTTHAPAEGSATTLALTQPYHVVAIPAGSGNVTFEERVVEGDYPEVPMRTLAHGKTSGIGERTTAEITDEESWRALWAQHVGGRDEPAPEVDFANERVLAVVLGDKPDHQWNVTIWQLTIQGPTLVAWASVEGPPDGVAQPMHSQAHHFIAIPRGPPAEFEMVPGNDAAADDAEDAPRDEMPGESLMRTLASGSQSGHEGDVRRVIATGDDWRMFWERHASAQLPPPDAPDVDFGRERVVAVVLADKPNGCWAVRIENPNVGADEASVDVVTYTPPPDMMCTQQVTQPFHFVALPHGAPLELREMQAQGPPPEA